MQLALHMFESSAKFFCSFSPMVAVVVFYLLFDLFAIFFFVFPLSVLLCRLLVEFCRITKTDLEVVMKRRQAEMTHNLLIFGLQRTLAFETSLNKMYTNSFLSESDPDVIVHLNEAPTTKRSQSHNPFDDDTDNTETSPTRANRACPVNDGHKVKSEDNKDAGGTMLWRKQPFDGIISRLVEIYVSVTSH